MEKSISEIAGLLDHSILHPATSVAEFEAGIEVAIEFGTASVCIVPWYLKRCAERLSGSGVRASTVIGFPHGGHVTAAKLREAEVALADGAVELDAVVNVGAVVSGRWGLVTAEVGALTEMAHAAGARIKIIFENCYLEDAHKERLCGICAEAGVDWVKTSTGFGSGGAVDADLALMRRCSPASVQVKASGGIRSYERVLEVMALGVSRIGTSSTRAILEEARARARG